MARPKQNEPIRPKSAASSEADWSKSNGTFIGGRAHIDGADDLAEAMEQKWGVGRLRLLVGAELREKFDRQRYLYNQAIWNGDLESVRKQSARMQAAWRALDKAATDAGCQQADPDFWECCLDDGSIALIARQDCHRSPLTGEGRRLVVYTLDEIARLLSAFPAIAKAKETIPGISVVRATSAKPRDPLDAIPDAGEPLDDIPF
jgi:hypothetical protein